MRIFFITLLSIIFISIILFIYNIWGKEGNSIDNEPIKTSISKTIKDYKSSENNLDIKDDETQIKKVAVTKKINSNSIVVENQTNFKKNNEEKIKSLTINNLDTDNAKNLISEDHLFLITTISLIVASLSIIVSLYLYYWRYKLIVNKDFLIPEKVVSELSAQSEQFNKLSQYNLQVGQLIDSQLKKTNTEISELKNILIQFQKSLNEKDDMISRYQKGYDNKIFKNFIGRFYRTYKFLIDLEQSNGVQNSDFKKIKTLLNDAFDQSGVEIFFPDIGINYLDEGEILDDNPIIKLTANEKYDNKVIAINNPGLRFIEKEINDRVIIKSKVTILQFKEDS
jgi:hypothetical protein